jgi:hypothetical protein
MRKVEIFPAFIKVILCINCKVKIFIIHNNIR